jgi:RNA polymerase sigma-70 factor (ECF subfamily)
MWSMQDGHHSADVAIASACACGDEAAIAELERLLARVPQFVAHIDGSPAFADETRQLLRERLLVPRPGRPPRIADYTGRGPLTAWLRIAAVRTAIDLRRRVPLAAPLSTARLVAATGGPEEALAKAQGRRAGSGLLAEALAQLSGDDRKLLRLHHVDGLSIDDIAQVVGMHRATIARRLVRLRADLWQIVRKLSRVRLNLDSGACRSLIAAAESQLAGSVQRLLQAPRRTR